MSASSALPQRLFMTVFAAAAAGAAFAAAPGFSAETHYTSIAEKTCRKFDVVRINGDEFAASRACRGHSGYNIYLREDDLRETLSVGKTLKDAAKEPAANDHYDAFNHYEDKVEWRSESNGKPYALIVEWSYADNENLEHSGRPKSQRLLVVMRLPPGPVCKVAYVDLAANANATELARDAADGLARGFKCGTDKVRIVGTRGRAIQSMSPPDAGSPKPNP
jgi:hypothetical protein